MSPRSITGVTAAVVAALVLVLAPQAQARETAKFSLLSVTGGDSFTHHVVYPPSIYGSCAFTMTKRITVHSTKRVTAYAHTSRSHGRARVAWSPLPEYTHNFTVVEVPAEVTIKHTATYQQTDYVDPDTGETTPGCYQEQEPVDCEVERTLPATLEIGGTSGDDASTYAQLIAEDTALYDACFVYVADPSVGFPALFSRADLFKPRPKRLSDTDRVEVPVSQNPADDDTHTGTVVHELSMELKRKKLRR